MANGYPSVDLSSADYAQILSWAADVGLGTTIGGAIGGPPGKIAAPFIGIPTGIIIYIARKGLTDPGAANSLLSGLLNGMACAGSGPGAF
jgi:hypothetical protein